MKYRKQIDFNGVEEFFRVWGVESRGTATHALILYTRCTRTARDANTMQTNAHDAHKCFSSPAIQWPVKLAFKRA